MPPDLPTGGAEADNVPAADGPWLERWCDGAWRRWRVLAGVYGAVLGLAAALVVHAILTRFGRSAGLVAAIVGLLVLVAVVARTRGVRNVRPVLVEAERAHPDLRNALLAWHETGRDLPSGIAARLAAQARGPLTTAARPNPYGRGAWSAALGCLAVVTVAGVLLPHPLGRTATVTDDRRAGPSSPSTAVPLDWMVTVTPPPYARAAAARLLRPTRVEALAGSRLELTFTSWPSGSTVRFGADAVPVDDAGPAPVATLMLAASDVVLVRDARNEVLASIAVVVRPDAAPRIRIVAPAADLRRASATGVVPIRITAQDDLGLRDLRLRYTKVSGSGESFTFVDGEWPVQVSRPSATAWDGTYALDLAGLGLGPGDSVVYHAVAHDARVGAEGAAESERYLIEIPRVGDVAGGDFSLPDPEEKFALSQRMVIQLTERLLERRSRLAADDYLQEAQSLAIAQRRVRAEFVFMLGGEVEDEFEEAAHSHEVEAGRLDNRGRGDLTEAVRQMAQAEARLTAADLQEALPYEYRALAALQAAFGKARYFMRTRPVPVQIDAARRLQGDRATAASTRWERAPIHDDQRAAATAVLRGVDAARPGDRAAAAALLPALIALDRGNADWVALAQRVLEADGSTVVARALRTRLLAASPAWMPVPLPRMDVEASTPAGTAGRRP